jgi:hypothetical protein
VRSHYGDKPQHLTDREKIYRASNAIADWLGLNSWAEIATQQLPEQVAAFRERVQAAE